MAQGDELKKDVKESVKNVVRETVGNVTSQIAKASTKKIIKKLTEKIKEKALHMLEHCSKEISEHGLEGQLDKSAGQVARQLNKSIEQTAEKIAKGRFERVDFIKNMEKGFEKGFRKCLSSPLKAIVITIVCLAVVGGVAWAIWPSPPPPEPPPPLDMTPPEVEIGHSPEIPYSDQQVTFTVEAWDDVAIDRIQLVVDWIEVKTSNSSPCIYVGGPYGAGTSVSYGAYVYDKAGNRTWTGEQTFYISNMPPTVTVSPIIYPDLVITDIRATWTPEGYVIHYWIKNQGIFAAGASNTRLSSIYQTTSDYVSPLPAGETREETFPPYKYSELYFKIELCADGDYLIREFKEDNNCQPYEHYY